MQFTWMTELKIKNANITLEYYYYFNYLFFIFNKFSFYNYKFFISHVYWKITKILKFFLFDFDLTFSENKKINYNLNLQINYKLDLQNDDILFKNNVVTKYLFKTKFSFFKTRLFNLFSLFNYLIINDSFDCHHKFRFFYFYGYTDNLLIIDVKKFLFRWNDALNLLFNIFFYNFNSLVFGSPRFKNETLALNWNYNNFDVNLWKYYFAFFIFKLNSYNTKTAFFFDKMASLDISFFLITDCLYHYKNIFYMRRKKYYSLGLVSSNVDPWIVTYPIVCFSENLLIQLFFFKLLILIQRQALLLKFNYFKVLWFKFLWINYNKIN
jgi:hypothetical protein